MARVSTVNAWNTHRAIQYLKPRWAREKSDNSQIQLKSPGDNLTSTFSKKANHVICRAAVVFVLYEFSAISRQWNRAYHLLYENIVHILRVKLQPLEFPNRVVKDIVVFETLSAEELGEDLPEVLIV